MYEMIPVKLGGLNDAIFDPSTGRTPAIWAALLLNSTEYIDAYTPEAAVKAFCGVFGGSLCSVSAAKSMAAVTVSYPRTSTDIPPYVSGSDPVIVHARAGFLLTDKFSHNGIPAIRLHRHSATAIMRIAAAFYAACQAVWGELVPYPTVYFTRGGSIRYAYLIPALGPLLTSDIPDVRSSGTEKDVISMVERHLPIGDASKVDEGEGNE